MGGKLFEHWRKFGLELLSALVIGTSVFIWRAHADIAVLQDCRTQTEARRQEDRTLLEARLTRIENKLDEALKHK